MRIRLLIAIPFHEAGQVVEVVPNWQRQIDSPKWLTADEHPVGVFAHEAEQLQPCGHSVSSIVGSDEGTSYCAECAAATWEENMNKLKELVHAGREAVELATDFRIANAARLAADDIALVFRIWPYSNLDPLGSQRALLDVLIPPAMRGRAKDGEG